MDRKIRINANRMTPNTPPATIVMLMVFLKDLLIAAEFRFRHRHQHHHQAFIYSSFVFLSRFSIALQSRVSKQ